MECNEQNLVGPLQDHLLCGSHFSLASCIVPPSFLPWKTGISISSKNMLHILSALAVLSRHRFSHDVTFTGCERFFPPQHVDCREINISFRNSMPCTAALISSCFPFLSAAMCEQIRTAHIQPVRNHSPDWEPYPPSRRFNSVVRIKG
jgi:hypothetical protein